MQTRRSAMARATLLSSVWILPLFALLTSAAFDMSRSDNVRVSPRTQVSSTHPHGDIIVGGDVSTTCGDSARKMLFLICCGNRYWGQKSKNTLPLAELCKVKGYPLSIGPMIEVEPRRTRMSTLSQLAS